MFPFSIVSIFLMHDASCLPSMLLLHSYFPLSPSNAIYAGRPSRPFHSDSETHLTVSCLFPFFATILNSHALFYCFIRFDFLNILTIKRDYS